MSARLSKLEALLSRLQRRSAEPPAQESYVKAATLLASAETATIAHETPAKSNPIAAETAQAPSDDDTLLSLDSPSLIPPSMEVASFTAPELDEPMIDVGEETLDRDQVDVEIDSIEVDSLDFDEVPESGPVVSTMDRAFNAHDASPITPPPESTEEAISTPNAARSLSSHSSFEASQSFTPPQSFAAPLPTMEQVGETVDLDEDDSSSDLELDQPITHGGAAPAPTSTREASILPGSNIESVRSPAETAEELARYALGETAAVQARVSKRPVLSTNVVELVSSSKDFLPKSFVELLDSTLSLK